MEDNYCNKMVEGILKEIEEEFPLDTSMSMRDANEILYVLSVSKKIKPYLNIQECAKAYIWHKEKFDSEFIGTKLAQKERHKECMEELIKYCKMQIEEC